MHAIAVLPSPEDISSNLESFALKAAALDAIFDIDSAPDPQLVQLASDCCSSNNYRECVQA